MIEVECGVTWRQPFEHDTKDDYHWSYGNQNRICRYHPDHEGKHRPESAERVRHGGRDFTDKQVDYSARVEKQWEQLDRPQPTREDIDHFYQLQTGRKARYRAFESWVVSLGGKKPLPLLRQVAKRGDLVTCTVHTLEQLKRVVDIYSDFSEFAFDVETLGSRKVRMLNPARRALSRYGEDASPCLACGRPIPTKRRAYCSDICRKAAGKDKPALDTKTNTVWCVSLAGPGRSDVIPCGHPDPHRQLHRSDVFEALEPLFFSDRRKINQNVGFDLLSIAKYYGNRLPPPPYADVMTMIFLINENLGRYNLGALSHRYLGYQYAEKLGEEAYRVEWDRAMLYSITDAKMAWMLWWKISPVLSQRTKEKLAFIFNLEMEVLQVLLEMKRTGAYVDVEGFRSLYPTLEKQLEESKADIYKLRDGRPINLNSPKQLGNWLYDELKLPCIAYTDTGQRKVDADTLRKLSRRHMAPRKILTFKDVSKLLTVYVAGFMPHIDDDSRIRASFNQAVAKTGRLSCSAPNLQNIPARYRENTEGTMIRQLFVAPPGKRLIVADYSQIELRILAHQTKDELLVYAYKHDLDLHLQTAALIWRIPQDQVDAEQRAIAKNSNFNLAFEGGPGRIVEMSGIPLREAEKVYEAWHQAYPGVKAWGRWVKRSCLERGYVETLYGRKRRLSDIASSDMRLRSYAERQAVNHPIQGTAADIAKIGLVQVHQMLEGYDAHLTLQIHDEFVIEVSEDQVDVVIPRIRDAMEDIQLRGRPVLDVPLEVNIGVGQNWSLAK